VIVLPDERGLARAVDLLRAGSVVAFPTETVYGLGADAFNPAAVAEIYRLKNRPSWNPLIAHVATVEAARELAAEWPDTADKLASSFWPGPLTLVVRRGDGTLAIRIPAHDVALRLLDAVGIPLAAPSANRSEGISPTTAQHVVRSLPEVPLVLDGGSCAWGIESTVLDVTCGVPRLLRPGALGLRAIHEVAGPVALPSEVDDGVRRPSPGMSRRHYAPRARLVLVDEIKDLDGYAGPVGVLTYQDFPRAELLSPEPREYAADLYAALHRLDDAGVATIVALNPPATEEWLAVRDRLSRAAR
jgi:L-threonylcarbamoyladenylate synthase